MTLTKIYRSITSREWKFVALVAVAAVLIINWPYFLAWLFTPEGYIYNGVNLLSSADSPVYYAYITQAAQGNLAPINLFTLETQAHGVFNIVWAGLGLISRATGWSGPLVFQLSRLALSLPFIFGLYFFISYFFKPVWQRRASLLGLLATSGLGFWLVVPLLTWPNRPDISAPVDLWVPEANIFLTLYRMPHFIISWALLMAVILLVLLAWQNKNYKYSLAAGLAALIWFSFHPYYVFYVFGVLAIFLAIKSFKDNSILGRDVLAAMLVFVISAPAIFYHVWLIFIDPAISFRAAQNITLTPNIMWVMAGYGLLFLAAVWAVAVMIKKKQFRDTQLLFLSVWFIANLLLLYFPIPWQRRMLQGWQLPMVLLSVWLVGWGRQHKGWWTNFLRHGPMLGLIIILLLIPTNVYILARDSYYFYSQTRSDLFFISRSDRQAMAYLSDLPKYKNVMTAWLSGLMIPGFSGQKVFAGHGHETLNPESKLKLTEWFYSTNGNDAAKQDFLKSQKIDILFYGEREAALGDFDPSAKPYLKPIFTSGETALYQVL